MALPGHGPLLVVMDVDSTFIRDEVIELLARHAGREAEVAAVTEAAMRGEIDFAESLRARCRTLAGLDVTVFDDVLRAVRPTPGADVLVAELQRRGDVVGLVSGGFAEIVEPLARRYRIPHVQANRLEVREGRLTGRVEGQIVDRAGKERALRRFAEAEGIGMDRTVAIGDGANDLDMMAAAALGIAFGAKPVVRAQADAVVDGGSLTAVLDLLGYTRRRGVSDVRAGP